MRVKSLLVVTAIVSSLLGAIMAYLALTVPNDLKSAEMLRQARKEISARKHEDAQKTLTTLIQKYPRTDAAAAATVALVTLIDGERAKLANDVAQLRKAQENNVKAITAMGGRVTELANRPVPQPQIAAPKPPVKQTIRKSTAKTTNKKKAAPKRRTRRR